MCDPNDPSRHDYGRGVEQPDGSRRWVCTTCGDVVTLSKSMADQLRSDADRLRADAARTLAERSADARDRRNATIADLVPRTIAALAAYQAARQTTGLAEAIKRTMVDAWESKMEAARALVDTLEAEHMLDQLAATYREMMRLRRPSGNAGSGSQLMASTFGFATHTISGQIQTFPPGAASPEDLLRWSVAEQELVIEQFTAKDRTCTALRARHERQSLPCLACGRQAGTAARGLG